MTELAFSHTFKLGNRFAQGSRGMLYECTNNVTGKKLACKIVRGEDNIRVNHSEEKMARACKHENIVKLHQVSLNNFAVSPSIKIIGIKIQIKTIEVEIIAKTTSFEP